MKFNRAALVAEREAPTAEAGGRASDRQARGAAGVDAPVRMGVGQGSGIAWLGRRGLPAGLGPTVHLSATGRRRASE